MQSKKGGKGEQGDQGVNGTKGERAWRKRDNQEMMDRKVNQD